MDITLLFLFCFFYVCYSNKSSVHISIFLLKTTNSCVLGCIIVYVKVARKQPSTDFLLNRFFQFLIISIFLLLETFCRVLEKQHIYRSSFMVRLQAFSLWLYWEWTSSWVFLDLCWNVQNYPFCRTTLGGWFHMSILSKWHISERNILYYSNIKVFVLLWDTLLLYLLAWSVDVAL